MNQLIEEAVVERDAARRLALLTLADHWADLQRSRRATDPATGPGRAAV